MCQSLAFQPPSSKASTQSISESVAPPCGSSYNPKTLTTTFFCGTTPLHLWFQRGRIVLRVRNYGHGARLALRAHCALELLFGFDFLVAYLAFSTSASLALLSISSLFLHWLGLYITLFPFITRRTTIPPPFPPSPSPFGSAQQPPLFPDSISLSKEDCNRSRGPLSVRFFTCILV